MNSIKILKLTLLITMAFSTLLLGYNQNLILEKTFNVEPGQKLELDTEGGDVLISSWAKNQVEIKIYGNSKAEKHFDFEFNQSDEGVSLLAENESNFWSNLFSSVKIKFEVKVPDKFNLRIKTSGGDVSLDSVEGDIKLNTSGGDINTATCKGKIYAKTSGGDIKLNECYGSIFTGTSGGDIRCKKINGDLEGKTSGGDITAEVTDGKLDLETSGGDITVKYSGENKGIFASTSGGDITVYVDPQTRANLQLSTSGGDVDYKFGGLVADEITSSKLIGSINGGGKTIKCRTSGGDVKLLSN